MKRRLLSAFLAVMMVLTMAPMAFAANTETTTEYVAQVDGNKYETLADAIEAANDGDTITLLKGGNGNGFKVPEGRFTEQGLTIDFNQFTYMIGGQLVGSAGTGTNGCQLLKNNKITFKNGSFVGATEGSKPADDTPDWHGAPAIMIQNYCDLTLENMIVTGGDETVYTFSNNCGNTVIKDSTINAGKAKGYSSGPFAFDVCRYSTYPSVSVTVQGSSVINGDVEISGTIGAGQSRQLNIEDGTFNGRFVVSNTPANISITGGTFSSDVSAYCDANYVTAKNADNTYTVKPLKDVAVAKVGDTYYKTLSAAVAAAQSGETVKLLANIAEGATIPADKTVTLDLNGKNIKPTTGDAIVNKGNLTIVGSGEVAAQNGGSAAIANFPGATANVNGGTFVSAHWYVIKNLGNMTIDGPVTIKKPDGNTDTSSLVDNGWVNPSDLVAGEQVAAQADKAKLTIKSGKFTGKSGSASCSVIKNDDYATLDISGGNFDSTNNKNTSNATTILNWNVATISGGTFIGQYPLANGAYTNAADKGQFTISGGTFTGLQSLFGYGQGGDGVGKITITDGNFAAPAFGDWGSAYTMEISGGYFTTDPSKYLATYTDAQKKYIAKAVTGDYKFHVELADANDLQVVPVAGATAAPSKDELKNNKDIPSDQVDNIVTAAKAVSAPEISEAAQEVAANISNNSNTLDKQYQDAAKNEVPNQEKIEVRTYLDVEPKAYNEKSAYTLDITPKYDVVVVGTNTENEKVEKKVVEGQKLLVKNGDKVQVSIQLPTGFVQDKNTKLYVQHKGHEYDPKVNKSGDVYTATFTNPNGFSEFTISKTSQSVAKVGNNKYTTFQDAVNAVENNGTIEIVGGNKDYTATISGSSKTIKVKNSLTDKNIKVTVNGESKTIEPSKDATFTYTKPSSGGSSGGSSSGKTTYKVTTSAVNNGGVNASPSNAEKGATITITLSPDKGYKLDKLTITDGSGKTVSTVKKSDTVYTFTMPASAVKVGVSYVKATETPSETKFNDVSANDWFASAVDYVTGKGMMNGTADNTFSPKANTTRGMVVTVLYRLENQPSTSAASFTDVASGAYYANAVAWANANGIVSGYGSGKFGPNDKVTREQLAAILYRYAQYKKYDVSVGEDTNILSYDDAQSISSYAIPAIQWACGAGVVTGKSGSKLDPKGNATRAEVAAMLMRFCENVK